MPCRPRRARLPAPRIARASIETPQTDALLEVPAADLCIGKRGALAVVNADAIGLASTHRPGHEVRGFRARIEAGALDLTPDRRRPRRGVRS
jgi:hypothetical protein